MRTGPLNIFLALALVVSGVTTTVRAQPVMAPAAPAAASGAQVGTAPPSAPRPVVPPNRPRIGLVLSGGGARGLAHVGVLKVLERNRVPVDVIAGTSMGAIIGGLYASGMNADAIENELLKVDWTGVFASRVARKELPHRRKEEDFEISPVLEVGLHDGELRVPLGTLSSRGLEVLLRRYTLPVRNVTDFDQLPIPFRAVSTDMETGEARVLGSGDLALALRSSMSVPGVFAPIEVDGRILGDGGLVNNLPIDVAREMGADLVIVVNIGTPLAPRETLGSLVGVTTQMINILTEQNVQRSLKTLTTDDVLLAPRLEGLTSGDFAKTRELITAGQAQAELQSQQLARLSLDPENYLRWAAARPATSQPLAMLQFVQFEGSEVTHPERLAAQLESQPGKPFDTAAAERDARRLAGTGDYVRADFQLVSTPEGDGLVFDLEDKPWGPNYFRIGLDMATDFRGHSAFDIKIAHNRHWLDANGGEWRNLIQIGEHPRWFTEWYHPLNWTTGLSDDWFLSAYGEAGRRSYPVYTDGREVGRYRNTLGRIGVDLGQPWGRWGEVRIGLLHQTVRDSPEVAFADDQANNVVSTRETGLRLALAVDQLDYAYFTQSGYRFTLSTVLGRQRPSNGDEQSLTNFEGEGSFARTFAGRHTFNVLGRWQQANAPTAVGRGRYTLGGFQQLSGYLPGEVEGNYLAFARLSYYMRLTPPALTRGFFAGLSLEAGNAWASRSDMKLGDLRHAGSIFLGADTGIGPLYLGLAYAPKGDYGVYLVLGRP